MPILKNQRHELFANNIASGLSATQAFIKAGYSKTGADGAASRLLGKVSVKARVIELKAIVSEKAQEAAIIDKAWVLQHLVENVKRSMQEVEVIDNKGKRTGEFRYEGNVANRAMELIGKEIGMFVDRKEVTGRGGGPLSITVLDDILDANGTDQCST